MPTTMKTIKTYAFWNCENIVNVHITDITAWCGIQFYSNVSNPLYYADWLCSNGERLTHITVPEGTEEKPCKAVNGFAFYNYDNLISLSLPDSLEKIGNYAFTSCDSLTELYFGKNLKEVGLQTLYECKNLEKIYYSGTVSTWRNINFKKGNEVSSKVQVIQKPR